MYAYRFRSFTYTDPEQIAKVQKEKKQTQSAGKRLTERQRI